MPEEKDDTMLSWFNLFKQWGPWAIPLGVVCWLVVAEMPRRDSAYLATIEKTQAAYVAEIKSQRDYDSAMRSKQWQHDSDIHAKLIQGQDVQNKAALEQVYQLRRLTELIDKKQ